MMPAPRGRPRSTVWDRRRSELAGWRRSRAASNGRAERRADSRGDGTAGRSRAEVQDGLHFGAPEPTVLQGVPVARAQLDEGRHGSAEVRQSRGT